jgi:feruloyl-CoA synthase
VKDVVIAGHDRDEVTALIFADSEACARLSSSADIIRSKFRSLLASFAGDSDGSSQRVERVILVEELPSLDAGEVTDKGSINQRAVLANRASMVECLYASPAPKQVISARSEILEGGK